LLDIKIILSLIIENLFYKLNILFLLIIFLLFGNHLQDSDLINLGFNKCLRSDQYVLFWTNRWDVDCALYNIYSRSYSIVLNPTLIVAQAFETGVLHIDFRRQLVGIYLQELNELFNHCSKFSLSSHLLDTCCLEMHPSGILSVYSFYEWLDFRRVINHEYDIV
jgi:hypothetical protein